MRMSLFFKQGKVIHKILSIACVVLVVSSCQNGEKAPDVSGVQVNLQAQRLDRDLATIDTNAVAAGAVILQKKYPEFFNFFLDTLMGFDINGNYSDTTTGIKQGLRVFLTNHDYKGLLDTVNVHFPDTKSTDEELKKGFQYMKYYYPNFHEPKIIYIVSWLHDWEAFTVGDNTLAIGLDYYLGPAYPYYKSVGVPEYMNIHLKPDYIPVAAFSVLYTNMHPIVQDGQTLLGLMLQYGKQQYFLHKVLPFVNDATRLGYTDKQMAWCEQNEAMVYNFFIRENLLYATEFQRIIRYVTDGPNSTGMPEESPGNIGSWLGYRIVTRYMQEHPETSLEDLFKETDSEKFLAASKYKPK